jgi:hypothetical protein
MPTGSTAERYHWVDFESKVGKFYVYYDNLIDTWHHEKWLPTISSFIVLSFQFVFYRMLRNFPEFPGTGIVMGTIHIAKAMRFDWDGSVFFWGGYLFMLC